MNFSPRCWAIKSAGRIRVSLLTPWRDTRNWHSAIPGARENIVSWKVNEMEASEVASCFFFLFVSIKTDNMSTNLLGAMSRVKALRLNGEDGLYLTTGEGAYGMRRLDIVGYVAVHRDLWRVVCHGQA